MADTPYPIPRELRQTSILVGDGVSSTYGPFSFKIFDIDDVEVYWKVPPAQAFAETAVTVAKVSGLPLDYFTVTFPGPLSVLTQYVVKGARLAERSTGITKGNQIAPAALEKELSKQAVNLQEQSRDLGRAVKVDFGENGLTVDAGLADGDTLMISGDRLVKGANALDIANAQANAAISTAAAAAAAASAATINLPPVTANTFLRAKADGTGYDKLTANQVASEINVQQRNIDGGFTMSATATSQSWGGPYAGPWLAAHRRWSVATSTYPGSRATEVVGRESTGSGTNGPAYADAASLRSSVKTNYVTSLVEGEIDVDFLVARQGRFGDVGGSLTDIEKVGGSTGGIVVHEAAAKWVDTAGTIFKRQQTVKNFGGQGSGFYGATGVDGIGFWAEAQIGSYYTAFMADQVGGTATYQNLLIGTTGRSVANIYYRVDGAGRSYAASGTGPLPGIAFQGDPDTGISNPSANRLGFSTGGALRTFIDTNGHFTPATDNIYSLGQATTGRWSNIYSVNAVTVGSDRRLKDNIIDSPLGLDFILGLRAVAYKLKVGGTEIEWVDDFEVIEEQETVEGDVVREERYFDGGKEVIIPHKERGPVLVWDEPVQATDPKTGELVWHDEQLPRMDDDGKPIYRLVEREPEIVRMETGELIEVPQPPEIVPVTDTVSKPVMRAVPKMRKVRKPIKRPVEVARAGRRQHFGFIAQEVKDALPEGVDFGGWVKDDMSDPESMQALRYEQFVPVYARGMQQMYQMIIEQQAVIDDLSVRISELEAAGK